MTADPRWTRATEDALTDMLAAEFVLAESSRTCRCAGCRTAPIVGARAPIQPIRSKGEHR